MLVDTIRPFEYRSRRISAGFPVEFACLEQVTCGVCLNIGDDGLRARMESEVQQGASGSLTLRPHGKRLDIEVEAIHSIGCQISFAFRFSSDFERDQAAELIASLEHAPRS